MLSLEHSSASQVWKTFSQHPRLLLAVALFLGSVVFATGGALWLLKRDVTNEILITSSESFPDNQNNTTILVDVEGAVNSPGVYSFPTTARVADAIRSAGGVSADVDHERLETELNLAMLLEDQQKIFVPRKKETVVNSPSHSTNFSLININTASNEELEKLPGIGAKRAADLIQGRPYNSVKDLERKQPIPISLIKDIEKLISY